MSDKLAVAIIGYKGRMGQTLLNLADAERCTVVAQMDQGDAMDDALERSRVAIDFSFHTATAELVEKCAELGVAVVIGTTGHTDEERQRIIGASQLIPIVWAGNYSIGVNLLFHLTETAAKVLQNQYQPEIVEIHHKHKKDAPSGTAINLAEALENAGNYQPEDRIYGREGDTGARPDKQVGIHALRGGEVIGEHTVYFFGENDRIELTHRASDRSIFASGAYRAAHWVTGRKPGLYNMRDVLGLNPTQKQPL
jgi:4-hydroxy-tetrahydrodipicolinate reductase